MVTANKAANLVGGKSTSTATARACDVCLCQRARWYCTADDAFLCQGCDSSVHSANQLACRHDRVRLEIKPPSSNYMPNITAGSEILLNSQPSWHQGFTRKARTPRNTKQVKPSYKVEKILKVRLPLVPEIGSSEEACPNEDDEERLLYRVPVFDPFAAQLCKGSNNEVERAETTVESEFNAFLAGNRINDELNNLRGFLPSDIELEEFAADVESLLGKGLDEDSCGIKGLGLLDGNEKDAMDVCLEGTKVKIEDEDEEKDDGVPCQLDMNLNLARQTIDWNFDYDDSLEIGDEDKVEAAKESTMMNDECKEEVKRKIFLRLNYEAVRAAWGTHCSPWTTGIRPQFNPDDDCWQDFMDWCATGYSHLREGIANRVRCDDGGREARVSRYREKRRTRLFSKKIRYEVRKLNAEKRPRMKGRFVKRMSFAGPSFPCLTKK